MLPSLRPYWPQKNNASGSVSLGAQASKRFWEFFTANIRNPNTRRAYFTAVSRFSEWCEAKGQLGLSDVQPFHVAAYIEELQQRIAAPSVKLQLAAIRMLFDWLVVGQIVPTNPASVVRGPKHVVKKGKTPVLSAEEARALLDAIDTSKIVGLRDRALVALLIYTFARVGAAVNPPPRKRRQTSRDALSSQAGSVY